MKTKLFIIYSVIFALFALSSCANKADEPSDNTDADIPSESTNVEFDEPSESEEMNINPTENRTEIKTEYERVACEYFKDYTKAYITGEFGDFDVYSHTVGSLGEEEKDRVIENILINDEEITKPLIENLNDFLSYMIKEMKLKHKYWDEQVTNYIGTEVYIDRSYYIKSKSVGKIAYVYLRAVSNYEFLYHNNPCSSDNGNSCYNVYLYKNGGEWLIYNVTTHDGRIPEDRYEDDFEQRLKEDEEWLKKTSQS